MVAPALGVMARDLHVSDPLVQSMILSVFVLAFAIGPLILAPCSEVYGRIPVLQVANLLFLAFNIGCGFANSAGLMVAFRFIAGLGGSASLAVSPPCAWKTWNGLTDPWMRFVDWRRRSRRRLACRGAWKVTEHLHCRPIAGSGVWSHW